MGTVLDSITDSIIQRCLGPRGISRPSRGKALRHMIYIIQTTQDPHLTELCEYVLQELIRREIVFWSSIFLFIDVITSLGLYSFGYSNYIPSIIQVTLCTLVGLDIFGPKALTVQEQLTARKIYADYFGSF